MNQFDSIKFTPSMQPECLLFIAKFCIAVVLSSSEHPTTCSRGANESRKCTSSGTAGIQDWRWQDRKRARPPAAAPSLGRPGVTKDDSCSVYVRNLPFHGTEQDIEDHFSSAGEVVDVRRGTQPDGEPCVIHLPCMRKRPT